VSELAAVADALEARLPGRVERDAPFGTLTTWRVGGRAAVMVRPVDVDDVRAVATSLPAAVPRIVLGRGSNLLVADSGFPGVVVALGESFEGIEIGAETVVAGGATALPVLARRCASAGRAGLGFYVGIPGSVGGAVRMNAGGHGRETVEVLRDATVVRLDGVGEPERRDLPALALGYRHSTLTDDDVVVAATFRVTGGDPGTLRAELGEIVRWRTEHQPGGANAGSVFRNPPGDAAARLIDVEAGLRGTRVGGAVVSPKHANFIQAEPGATAADVHQLLGRVRDRVAAVTGVHLEPEVRRIGFEEP
jgi:UDP-N-acetylmuramate dehydrogenase